RDFPRVSFADVVLRLLAIVRGSKFRTERARGTLSSSKRLASSSGSSYKNVCASHVSGASSSSSRQSLPHGRPFLLLNLPQEGSSCWSRRNSFHARSSGGPRGSVRAHRTTGIRHVGRVEGGDHRHRTSARHAMDRVARWFDVELHVT